MTFGESAQATWLQVAERFEAEPSNGELFSAPGSYWDRAVGGHVELCCYMRRGGERYTACVRAMELIHSPDVAETLRVAMVEEIEARRLEQSPDVVEYLKRTMR